MKEQFNGGWAGTRGEVRCLVRHPVIKVERFIRRLLVAPSLPQKNVQKTWNMRIEEKVLKKERAGIGHLVREFISIITSKKETTYEKRERKKGGEGKLSYEKQRFGEEAGQAWGGRVRVKGGERG